MPPSVPAVGSTPVPAAPVAAEPVVPSHDDPVVTGASQAIGGPLGRHAGRGLATRFTLAILLALTALTCVGGWVQKAPCRTHPWAHEYQYTRLCYSDVFALYFSEHLDTGKVPYVDVPVEYPVLIGGVMQLASAAVGPGPGDHRGATFFDLTAVLLGGCALVVTATTAALAGRRRRWDAAMVALSPVLLLHAYTNWDLLAVAVTGLALWAWARGSPLAAGIFLGLGTATKLYPALLLLPLLLLCWRARRLRPWLVTTVAAAVAWLAVDLPVWLTHPTAFGRFFALNSTRGADWDSLWLALQHLRGRALAGGDVAVLNAAVAAGVVAVMAAVTLLALRAPRPPRLAQLAFLTVAGFLLVNKVDSPQYVLWLLPLAVLAYPRWAPILAWQATEAAVMITRFYFFVGQDKPNQGLPYSAFVTAVLIRDAALLALAALIVRDVLRPEGDVVRRGGWPDPAGGVLAEQPAR